MFTYYADGNDDKLTGHEGIIACSFTISCIQTHSLKSDL